MLMPSVDFRDTESAEFQVNFVMSGGLRLLLSVLTNKKFMSDAGNSLKRCVCVHVHVVYTTYTYVCACMYMRTWNNMFVAYWPEVRESKKERNVHLTSTLTCTYMYMYICMYILL